MSASPTMTEAAAGAHLAVGELERRLRQRLPAGAGIRAHEPLGRRTTLRVGGSVDLLVEPGDESDLAVVLEEARHCGVPWMMLGRGSNLLVRDGGVRGLVISLARPGFCAIEITGVSVRCGAGARLRDVSQEARRRGVAGLEFLSGIPGSIGGALRMNAGAWNAMTFDVVHAVRFMAPDGRVQDRPASEVPTQYRRCDLFRSHIALGAVLHGSPSTPEAVRLILDDLNSRRWASQPAAASAGCIFKNPPSIPAGKLIEELGLKGTRLGGASVSALHGNFIVNDGHASASEVLALIDLIRLRAREVRGIELETEVEVIGE